jgi:ADP-glucose pyrophosphorylase
MDYELMLQQHVEPGAGVTVGCHDICPTESSALRIIGTDVHAGLSSAKLRRSPNRWRITPQDARAVAQPMIDGLNA